MALGSVDPFLSKFFEHPYSLQFFRFGVPRCGQEILVARLCLGLALRPGDDPGDARGRLRRPDQVRREQAPPRQGNNTEGIG